MFFTKLIRLLINKLRVCYINGLRLFSTTVSNLYLQVRNLRTDIVTFVVGGRVNVDSDPYKGLYRWDRDASTRLDFETSLPTKPFWQIYSVKNLVIFIKTTFNKISHKFTTKFITSEVLEIYIRSFSFGFYYIQSVVFLCFVDACLVDDEPLWEPIEWSLVQTWILLIFMFGWIAENLIVSRYGSYTGRDKRVWMSWYKTFWIIETYYILNFAVVASFVIVPFYFEINYSLPFVYTWWHWYSRVFFFKFTSLFTVVLYLSHRLQISLRWSNWKKGLVLIIIINIFLSYLIYTHFIMSFFGYLTNSSWYQQTRTNDYIQLSHEPSRWGWGDKKRDHFYYHPSRTSFWFKNDGPFASASLFFHLYFFLSLFFVYVYWISLFRRVIAMREIPLTYTTYCVSSLRQFFYSFLMLYTFVFISFITQYWRLPIELSWGMASISWLNNLLYILLDYKDFALSIILL